MDIKCERIEKSIKDENVKLYNAMDALHIDYMEFRRQEKIRTKKFNSIMTEIRDSSEDSNEEIREEIKKLAEQYESFEKMISAIVEQMSHMAEEDIKFMKGFLNG